MNAMLRSTGHLVIGGGLAGAMVGIRLAGAGRDVTLLEKERSAHHKVCGEFLSAEAVLYLREAGIDPLHLGAATIRRVRLLTPNGISETALPFTALSLSRRVLDDALLARASESGCNVIRGATVERIEARAGRWFAQLRDGESWCAPTAFLASGKHDVNALERGPGVQGELVGFKLHWRLEAAQTEALRDAMELFLFTGGYGGLSLVEGDAANLCLVVRQRVLRAHGGWAGLLAAMRNENPPLSSRLESAMPLWDRPLAIFPIPYGYLAGSTPCIWRVGDQAAVIPSFTGDGMSIALHSGALAAHMALAGKSADEYHALLRGQLRRAMWLSTMISKTMISRAGSELAPRVLSLLPDAMRWIASSTRIPTQAMAAAASP